MIRGWIYRLVMRIAHHYNLHYAPPIYPDGDTQLWCKWCGFRQTIRHSNAQGQRRFRVRWSDIVSESYMPRYDQKIETDTQRTGRSAVTSSGLSAGTRQV